jgi:hypothetical protein
MMWVRAISGVLCLLVGLVWIGQGIGLLPGSFMTGQTRWAAIGLALAAFGAWLLWGLRQRRRA